MTIGVILMGLGNLWFTQVSPDGTYAVDLLPGFFAIGIGLGFSFVPMSIAALAGVAPHEAGLASGLFNTSQQIGGALGVALFATVATNRTSDLLKQGESQAVGADERLHARLLGRGRLRRARARGDAD